MKKFLSKSIFDVVPPNHPNNKMELEVGNNPSQSITISRNQIIQQLQQKLRPFLNVNNDNSKMNR